MKLEDQVCSLELAQKLKELGAKQQSILSWVYHEPMDVDARRGAEGGFRLRYGKPGDFYDGVAAFTVGELGEMLPDFYYSYWCFRSYEYATRKPTPTTTQTHWECCVETDGGPPLTTANTEADSRAKMLIYLLEKKLITL